jgi:hypothetical protein
MERNKNNPYVSDIQKEINMYNDKCFDVVQLNERVQKFKEIYRQKF